MPRNKHSQLQTTAPPANAFVPGECLVGGSPNVVHWRGQTCTVHRVPIEDLPEHNARHGVRPAPGHPLRAIMDRSARWWPVVVYEPIDQSGPGEQTKNTGEIS